MRTTIKVMFALIGVIVGASFSTGQEALKFFSNHGMDSYIGIFVSSIVFILSALAIAEFGTRYQSEDHEKSMKVIYGFKFGAFFDLLLSLIYYCIVIVVVAGGGSTLRESFGVPTWLGTLLIVIVVFISLQLPFNKILTALGFITPLLTMMVVGIALFQIFGGDIDFSTVDQTAQPENASSGSAIWDGINYAGFTIATAFAFMATIGSYEGKEGKLQSIIGVILGAISLMVLLAIINTSILAELEMANSVDLPMLQLAKDIHPTFGLIISVIMLLAIYNTALGLSFAYTVRFGEFGTMKYKLIGAISLLVGYGLSFIGFVDLIGIVYKYIGIVGLFFGLSHIFYFVLYHTYLKKRKKA